MASASFASSSTLMANPSDVVFVLLSAALRDSVRRGLVVDDQTLEEVAASAATVSRLSMSIPRYPAFVRHIQENAVVAAAAASSSSGDTTKLFQEFEATVASATDMLAEAVADNAALREAILRRTRDDLDTAFTGFLQRLKQNSSYGEGDVTGGLFSDLSESNDADTELRTRLSGYASVAADILKAYSTPELRRQDPYKSPLQFEAGLKRQFENSTAHRAVVSMAFVEFATIYAALIANMRQSKLSNDAKRQSIELAAISAYNNLSPALRLIVAQPLWFNDERLREKARPLLSRQQLDYAQEPFAIVLRFLQAQKRYAPERLRVTQLDGVLVQKGQISVAGQVRDTA